MASNKVHLTNPLWINGHLLIKLGICTCTLPTSSQHIAWFGQLGLSYMYATCLTQMWWWRARAREREREREHISSIKCNKNVAHPFRTETTRKMLDVSVMRLPRKRNEKMFRFSIDFLFHHWAWTTFHEKKFHSCLDFPPTCGKALCVFCWRGWFVVVVKERRSTTWKNENLKSSISAYNT